MRELVDLAKDAAVNQLVKIKEQLEQQSHEGEQSARVKIQSTRKKKNHTLNSLIVT